MRAKFCAMAAGLTVAGVCGVAAAGNSMNLLFPFDVSNPAAGGWSVVPFSANGAQGSGPASPADPLQRNDDDYAGPIALGFDFCFYGADTSSVFINNNGNLTFGGGDSSFTPFAFPATGLGRIAPFFADVDTRNSASGVAWYSLRDTNGDSANDTLIVTWDNVGYFSNQADKTNTFQVAITNSPTLFGGNNVAFSYDDMSWTTGSASGGTGGFGGSPATVGINRGNGTDYFAVGRFDHEGTDYDGSGGVADGVSWLDGQDFFFDICGTSGNIPPVALGLPSDGCYEVDVGDVLAATITLIGPELGDAITSISVTDLDGAQAAGLVIGTTLGDPGSVSLNWTPDAGDVGEYDFILVFSDSFGNTTTNTFCIEVVPAPGAFALLGLGGVVALRRRRAC